MILAADAYCGTSYLYWILLYLKLSESYSDHITMNSGFAMVTFSSSNTLKQNKQ